MTRWLPACVLPAVAREPNAAPRAGGVASLVQRAPTEPGRGAPPGLRREDRATQRNRSAASATASARTRARG